MEVVKHCLKVWAALPKGFREVRVHVAGCSLDALHPLLADEFDEVVDDTLLLPFGDEKHMAGFKVNDVGVMSVMELEFIDSRISGCMLWLACRESS